MYRMCGKLGATKRPRAMGTRWRTRDTGWCKAQCAVCEPPPAQPQVLLADSGTEWEPPEGAEHLWTALLAAYLHSVWQLRGQRSLAGRQFSAASVCAAVVAAVRGSIRRDWARATKDLVKMSGAPEEWFRGSSPALKLDAFRERWEFGALCTVVGGPEPGPAEGAGSQGQTSQGPPSQAQPPQLTLHFSLAHPVPAPAASLAAAAGPPAAELEAAAMEIDSG